MANLVVVQTPFVRKLTVDGTVGGDANANSDYSGASAAEFWYQPASDEIVVIKAVTARLTSSGAIDATKFSGLGALTVGVQIYTSSAAVGTATYDLTGNSKIKTNGGFQEHFTCTDLMGAIAATQKVLTARWDLDKMFDANGIIISGAKSERFAVYFNDDLSPATNVSTEFLIHGCYLTSEMGHAYIQDDEV
jgi:hypothetical protein